MFSLSKRFVVFSVMVVLMHNYNVVSPSVEERKDIKTVLDLLLNIGNGIQSGSGVNKPYSRLDCPLCDSSVYSYCSEKLLHDACCCLNPYEHKLPYQCNYADCGFLHANSCREHKLITACCCAKVPGPGKDRGQIQKDLTQ